jgi:hypothetical protein
MEDIIKILLITNVCSLVVACNFRYYERRILILLKYKKRKREREEKKRSAPSPADASDAAETDF